MTEDYVSFEIAKLLKEKGFNAELDMVYSEYGELHRIFDKEYYDSTNQFATITNSNYNDITKYKYDFFVVAPTLQMAMKYLRNIHKLCISITPQVTDNDGDGGCLWEFTITKRLKPLYASLVLYESYGGACEDAIKYCLENLI